jgi:hypothetical protein
MPEKKWKFTAKRKASLRKAQKEHVELIEDGLKWRRTHSK